MWSRSRTRLLAAAAALLLLPGVVTGCVPGSRQREIAEERDRLARENLDLRRRIIEQQVLLEEALEALHGRPGGGQAGTGQPAPGDGAPPELPAPGAGAGAIPEWVAPPGTPIQDEDIRSAPQPGSEAPSDAQGYLKVARWYAGSGKTREAISAYSRLIQEHPFSSLLPEAFMERGRLRLKGGDRTGALEDFDTVAEAFPASPLAEAARREGAALRAR